MRTVCGAAAMGVPQWESWGREASDGGHAGVILPQKGALARATWCTGADRAWWSDWSSKPAGVLLDLGRFDSYTLPPHPVQFVSHWGDRLRRTCLSNTRCLDDRLLRPVAPALQYKPDGSRGVSRAPCFAQLCGTETGLRALGPLPAAPPASSPSTPTPPGPSAPAPRR